MVLPFGVFYALYENQINTFIRRYQFFFALACAVTVVATYFASMRMESNYLVSNFLFKNIGAIAFVLFVIIFLDKVNVSWEFLEKLGQNLSMEIYFIHLILREPLKVLIENKMMYVFLVVVLTIALAFPLSLLNKKLVTLAVSGKGG